MMVEQHRKTLNRRRLLGMLAGLSALPPARAVGKRRRVLIGFDFSNRVLREIADSCVSALQAESQANHPAKLIDLPSLPVVTATDPEQLIDGVIILGDKAAAAFDQAGSRYERVPRLFGALTEYREPQSGGRQCQHYLHAEFSHILAGARRLMPAISKVGVLVSDLSDGLLERLALAAARNALTLIQYRANRVEQLSDGLNYLANRTQAVITMPDRRIYNGATARTILLFSLRERLPLIAPSCHWVKGGALFGQHWDYQKLGKLYVDALGSPGRSLSTFEFCSDLSSAAALQYCVNQRSALMFGMQQAIGNLPGAKVFG